MRTHPAHPARWGTLWIAALLLVVLAAPALPAAAAGREFHGRIVRVGGKTLVVENRMGDVRRFRRTADTRVEGRPGWQALAAGDRVIVQYAREGERNAATRVIVLGPRP